jgi:hypothetical protein
MHGGTRFACRHSRSSTLKRDIHLEGAVDGQILDNLPWHNKDPSQPSVDLFPQPKINNR